MIARFGDALSRLAGRWMPDPFIFALLLTLVTLALGVVLTPNSPAAMVGHWMSGFWDLLTFSMQMVLILVTGGVLAQSPPVRRVIDALAARPHSTGSAVVLVSLAAMIAALVNWGLGLIVGALLARGTGASLKARGIPHHYPLIGAAGYTGLLVWHGGLSGSAPLSVATPGHFLESVAGIIPVTATTFSGLNLALTLALLAVVPLILRAMTPRKSADWQGMEGGGLAAGPDLASAAPTPARTLNESRLLGLLVCLPALGFLVWHFSRRGLAGLDLNSMNLAFLFLGFLFFLRPLAYARAVGQAVSGSAGIILQFPFYAGIMGMMRDSGLVEVFSGALVSFSSPVTFAPLAFLSGGLVNLFVPSGGGQWAVQGPILLEAAAQLGVSPSATVMALAYGDQWTNMLQPFWALPLLGLTGLEARQIIGYSSALMILVAPVIIAGLIIFSL
ncbi:MAG: short-chain fatty acid transporter [Candidatus Zixiibacteriota bacterium]|nr:MAG: short-chain fatty acid transporter [candidate division Zixibacteria bacterium]